jgi:hypothetical protein
MNSQILAYVLQDLDTALPQSKNNTVIIILKIKEIMQFTEKLRGYTPDSHANM